MKKWLLVFLAVGLGAFTFAASAADWPQWRGPQRNGSSNETEAYSRHAQGRPEAALAGQRDWRRLLDACSGRFADLPAEQSGTRQRVRAGGVSAGWQIHLDDAPRQCWQSRSATELPDGASTPTIDRQLVYVFSSDGDLACLETATGKLRWQKSLRKDFGGQPGQWAYSESPLIDGDVVVATPGGAEATIVALNKKTGAVIWKSAVPGGDPAGYAPGDCRARRRSQAVWCSFWARGSWA